MVKLEKIQSALFPRLYDAFLHDDDPQSNEQDWRNVFDYAWDKEQDHCGYALLDGDEVVGMIGMVYCERLIDGNWRKFCNLHTWWVREDVRGHSLALLRPICGLKDHTVTHFTPCDTIRAVTQKLGFEPLSTQLRILLPLRPKRRTLDPSSDVSFDPTEIVNALPDPEAKIVQDHLPYRCGHLILRDGAEHCYLLYTHVVRHRLPYCHVHFVSNRKLFAAHEETLRGTLLRRHDARFVAMDQRLVKDMRFRRSFKFWAPAHAMVRSPDVRPDQIDNLYSDVVMLRLTVLPDITHEIRTRAKRWLPFNRG